MTKAEEMRQLADNVNHGEHYKVLENIVKSIEDLAKQGKTSCRFDKGYSFVEEGLTYENYDFIKEELDKQGFYFSYEGFQTLAGYVTHLNIEW